MTALEGGGAAGGQVGENEENEENEENGGRTSASHWPHPESPSGPPHASTLAWNCLAAFILDGTSASEGANEGRALFATPGPVLASEPDADAVDALAVGDAAGLDEGDCTTERVRERVRQEARRAWIVLVEQTPPLARAILEMEGVVSGSRVVSSVGFAPGSFGPAASRQRLRE
jgi:hypothetical protein